MKVIIAGGRRFVPSEGAYDLLCLINDWWNITEVVSGGAYGADSFGEVWALNEKIDLKIFKAKWQAYGKRAGFLRNEEMAGYADGLIAFPGGKGTEHMIKTAKKAGLKIIEL